MKRLADWQDRLASVVCADRGPLRYGIEDCCLFAADCVQAVTGVDPAREYRGYDVRTAARLLRRHGGLIGLVSSILGEPSPPNNMMEGDIVAVPGRNKPALGVVLHNCIMCICRERVPVSSAIVCWRIGHA